jgi:hypothetical protein
LTTSVSRSRAPTRLQERRKVRPLPQLRDRQLNLPDPRVPDPLAIPVALRATHARGALAELGADLRSDLGLHELSDDQRHALAQHVDVF